MLIKLPFSKPAVIECKSDIDAEGVLRNHILCRRANPLRTDIEDGTVVPLIDDRESETAAYGKFLRSFQSVDFKIRSGVTCSETVTYARSEVSSSLVSAIFHTGFTR